MTLYFVKKLTDGAYVFERESSGACEIWVHVKLRKDTKCTKCWNALAKGSSGYRPIGNGLFRANRLCVPCTNKVIQAA